MVNKNIQRVSVFEIHANSICSYKPPVSSDQIFDGNTRWMRRINVTLRGDIPVSDVTSLTRTTPKTRRIYTRSGRRDTRINLHSRNTGRAETRVISREWSNARDPTDINAYVTDASSKGHGKGALGASFTAGERRGHSLSADEIMIPFGLRCRPAVIA